MTNFLGSKMQPQHALPPQTKITALFIFSHPIYFPEGFFVIPSDWENTLRLNYRSTVFSGLSQFLDMRGRGPAVETGVPAGEGMGQLGCLED